MGNCYSFLFPERSVHFLYSIVAVLMDWILFIGSEKQLFGNFVSKVK